MVVENYIYDKRFFDNTTKLEASSAKLVVDILIKHFKPRSIIDIGCGNGIYLREFINYGLETVGYEGAQAAIDNALVKDKIKLHDLCEPLVLEKVFDLVICIEVAEHLPEKYASTLINTLTNLSDSILFTAATPGQGPRSIGHINEQPHSYWIDKFSHKKFSYNENLTKQLRQEMSEKEVVWWITKNLMVFKKII